MNATPLCPRCGSVPWLLLDDGQQAFCSNDDCDVLAWNPQQSREELEASKTIIDAADWERT